LTVPDSNTKKMKVFVRLLQEGTEVSRPTEAISMGDGRYKLLPTANYDPGDEIWEFAPGTIVQCETRHEGDETYLLATRRVDSSF
jgi:hypothetical protein